MPHKLLLADDSVTIQRVIELTFADEDVHVTPVGTGQQAIDRIVADPPDIVLADVGMPDRDGYEVAAYVKERPELAHIPVLLLTGAFEPVDEARVAAARCEGVLAKPFEPQLLIARVKELLSSHQSRVEPAPAPRPEGESVAGMHAMLDAQPARGEEADVSLDDYFDRLDQAFASLAGTARPSPAAGVPQWSVRQEAPAARLSPAAPARPVRVADAFASILEAEASGQASASPAPAIPAPAPVPDEMVEQIVTLVIERMAEREARQAVADTVARLAERLLREEIDRLKALPRF